MALQAEDHILQEQKYTALTGALDPIVDHDLSSVLKSHSSEESKIELAVSSNVETQENLLHSNYEYVHCKSHQKALNLGSGLCSRCEGCGFAPSSDVQYSSTRSLLRANQLH
jgi:hypothetical protein